MAFLDSLTIFPDGIFVLETRRFISDDKMLVLAKWWLCNRCKVLSSRFKFVSLRRAPNREKKFRSGYWTNYSVVCVLAVISTPPVSPQKIFSRSIIALNNNLFVLCSLCSFTMLLTFCYSRIEKGSGKDEFAFEMFSCRWRPMSSPADYFQCFSYNELARKIFFLLCLALRK